ncbi:hypothetical protein QTJ16_001067 [Diplocarpon rosae]|uniref:Repetitive proline-rich cell wall protein n=1 Tax=Diplocarpon rosae TaxID=946125 RepID=A0AAD9T7F1_9HELO|nr:hypothetical protein QTJ16_001067 [Diplocarpon rosae]
MKSASVLPLWALITSVIAWEKETYTTTEVYVTYTTICPVTTTSTDGGKTYTKIYTTTSTIVDHVATTIIETVELPDTTIAVGVGETSIITSFCPITETKTIAGETVTQTWTSTSLIYSIVPTMVEATVTLAPTTKYIETYVYQTSTSLCPVTETKTISGKPVEVIYTSTSLVVGKIPTTLYETITLMTTYYATEDVYTTLYEYETFHTTISAGSTIVIPVTETNMVILTSSYTITETLENPTTKATVYVPLTLGTSIPVTEVITIPAEVTTTLSDSVSTATPSLTQSTATLDSSAPAQLPSNAASHLSTGPLALTIAGAMAILAFA